MSLKGLTCDYRGLLWAIIYGVKHLLHHGSHSAQLVLFTRKKNLRSSIRGNHESHALHQLCIHFDDCARISHQMFDDGTQWLRITSSLYSWQFFFENGLFCGHVISYLFLNPKMLLKYCSPHHYSDAGMIYFEIKLKKISYFNENVIVAGVYINALNGIQRKMNMANLHNTMLWL